jgi:hypothetical protein
MKCPVCANEFEKVTSKKFCSRSCLLADWRARNRLRLREISRRWNKDHPNRKKEIAKKYYESEQGQARYRANRSRQRPIQAAQCAERYRNDVEYREFLNSRQRARRKLLAAKHIPFLCSCGINLKLEAHHRDLNPMNNELGNLEWLCKKCHEALHASTRNAR